MTETSLIYPTLDLFLYDLREGLGQTSTQVDYNRLLFWKKIYRQITETQLKKLADAEKPEADFVLLLGSKKIEKFASPSDGHYFPVQLGDTYALQVDYSGTYADEKQETPNYAKQPAENIATLKKTIRSQIDNQQSTLGETWLLWAQLATDTQNAETTAQECYIQLGGKSWEQDLQSKGKFLGADVFELWQVPADWSLKKWEEFSPDNQHVIIFLFPATDDIKEIGRKMSKIYFDLMRLFCYRHKILWAYWQSCRLKADLKDAYREIREFNTRITEYFENQRLSLTQLQKDLTKALKHLSDYTENLNKFDAQARTIKTNFGNYQKRQKNFVDPDKNSQLAFIIGVGEGDFAPAKYQEQIELDYANLTPGLKLLENLIRNIEGIIEIEQTRSDRSLTFIVGVASIGLAVSGVTASLISSQLPSPKEPVQKGNPISLMDAFGWSLVPSLIFILAMLAWRKFRRN